MILGAFATVLDERALIAEAALRHRLRPAFVALAAFFVSVSRGGRDRLIVEDLIKLEKTGIVELVQRSRIGLEAKLAFAGS